MTSGIINLTHKGESFKKLALFYLIIGCIEVTLRYFYMPTPLSLLLPTIILSMHLVYHQHKLNIRNRWYLLLPFIGFTLLYLFLFIRKSYLDALYLWIPIFNIGYSLTALVVVAPLPIQLIKNESTLFSTWKSVVLSILFMLTVIFASVNLIMTHYYLPVLIEDKNSITILSTSFWVEWFLLLTSLLTIAIYLLFSRSEEERIVPTMEELESYKKEIVRAFNEEKMFLNPNFSLKVLAIESGIEQENLSYFFNYYAYKSFTQLTAEYRIGYALDLMQNQGSNYTLEAIANACGYRSRASFNKYFQLITGMLPSEYIVLINK